MPIVYDMPQRCAAWYKIRLGLVTASRMDSLVTKKTLAQSTGIALYSAKLAGELFSGTPDDWDGNNITAHGIEIEDQAHIDYQLETGNLVSIAGFVADAEGSKATCGCSPDGLVDDDGMTEIKAQFTQGHVADIVEHEKTGGCPTDYRLQVQAQMMIAERKWCDLILYHPHLPMKIIRVLPDPEIHEKMKAAITVAIEKRDEAYNILQAMRPKV